MTNLCLNCDVQLTGNFCSNCGQSAKVHKINFHFLIHDIQHGLLHLEKGFFYTTKELFTRPGHSIREFLAGKRVNHFKPISFAIILAGVYGIMAHYFEINLFSMSFKVSGDDADATTQVKQYIDKISEWISSHYATVTLMKLPLLALGSFLCFFKAGYNYLEHLIVNAFLVGQKLILRIICFPLFYYLDPKSIRAVTNVVELIAYIIAAWAFFQLFPQIKLLSKLFRILMSFALSMVLFILIITILFNIVLFS